MNYNNRKGRKALRGLMVRSAIHADTKKRKHLAEHRLTVLGMLFILTVIFCLGMMFQEKKLEWEVMANELNQVKQTRIASTLIVKPAVVQEATPSAEAVQTQEAIEAYIKKIFTKDAKVAIAVSHGECNPANKKYPACHAKSGIEHSVGIFQINLYNAKQWIHAGRIPGETMEEKIKWLEDPYNNTLYAYWVFTYSGWNPWTAYTSGGYKKYL